MSKTNKLRPLLWAFSGGVFYAHLSNPGIDHAGIIFKVCALIAVITLAICDALFEAPVRAEDGK